MEKKIIDRANELWEAGAPMGSGWDPDCPMTELSEAIAFLILEDEVLGDELDGGLLFEKLQNKLG